MASARLGCDLEQSHVICTPAAAAVIKTYSPNLMVHPLMREHHTAGPDDTPRHIADRIIALLPRLHVLVIGPGLGRDELMQDTVAHVIGAARERGLGLVLDADALQAVGREPGLVQGYARAVITPNVVEFKRLAEALGVQVQEGEEGTKELARRLAGPVVVRKGAADVVCDERGRCVRVDARGGLKRSGGQGDTLTGTIATLMAWKKGYTEGLWGGEDKDGKEKENKMSEDDMMVAAAVGGCVITRECARRAFSKKGRSMQASDLTDEVHASFLAVFPGIDGE
ncbi:hypothetical protein TD95_001820 [Thielaviopsis punctulata]|uniref:ATP-dependent (S)-NAD(P)H-hydrate dehydratase n=1 Tax=Thielaviopsis punctulata TaxID=72032 RepID=A0A0F4ZC96_9PEZI|nr:hypothetical protein TD95_001820 [Thielaviopsis punctulata]